jgi:uncharacterized protein (TIGR03437 family)
MFTLLTAISAFAQFTQLTATDDGKQLYFVSQQIMQGKARTGLPEYRLYRASTDGVTLFAERGALTPQNVASSSDGVSGPNVSGDGSLVAFTFNDVCLSGADCTSPVNEAMLRGQRSADLGPGSVQFSRNGQWAVLRSSEMESDRNNEGAVFNVWFTLVDLNTGARQAIPAMPDLYPARALASDGTIFVLNTVPGLWKQGTFAPLTLPNGFAASQAIISDDASTLVANRFPSGSNVPSDGIIAFDIASQKTRVVVQVSDTSAVPVLMAVSNNGQRVLYRVAGKTIAGPALVWDVATGVSTRIPLDDGELVTDGTLSGSGEVAFVVTTSARIAKFTLATGAVTSVFPAAPHCDDPGDLAMGSLARLRCTFGGTAADLQNHLFYNGTDLAVLYSKPGEIGIQIPWTKSLFGNDTLSNDLSNPSPFQAGQPLRVFEGAPGILPADPSVGSLFGIQIIKGDFSGYVTSAPLPGDIIHMYMIGLGPVDDRNANRIKWKLACRFQPGGPPVAPLFAGLAPGFPGVYQTTFAVPAGSGPVTLTDLSCDVTAPNGLTNTIGPGTTPFGMCSQCGFGGSSTSGSVRNSTPR